MMTIRPISLFGDLSMMPLSEFIMFALAGAAAIFLAALVLKRHAP